MTIPELIVNWHVYSSHLIHSDAPSQNYNFVFPGLNKNMKAHVTSIFKIEIFKIKTLCVVEVRYVFENQMKTWSSSQIYFFAGRFHFIMSNVIQKFTSDRTSSEHINSLKWIETCFWKTFSSKFYPSKMKLLHTDVSMEAFVTTTQSLWLWILQILFSYHFCVERDTNFWKTTQFISGLISSRINKYEKGTSVWAFLISLVTTMRPI